MAVPDPLKKLISYYHHYYASYLALIISTYAKLWHLLTLFTYE